MITSYWSEQSTNLSAFRNQIYSAFPMRNSDNSETSPHPFSPSYYAPTVMKSYTYSVIYSPPKTVLHPENYRGIFKVSYGIQQLTCHQKLFADSRRTTSCPLPPKPGFGVWVWEGLSGGSRAGITLKGCSQLAAFAIRPVGWDAAAVWLAEDGVFRCAPLPSSNLVAFGRVAARERQGALTRRAW